MDRIGAVITLDRLHEHTELLAHYNQLFNHQGLIIGGRGFGKRKRMEDARKAYLLDRIIHGGTSRGPHALIASVRWSCPKPTDPPWMRQMPPLTEWAPPPPGTDLLQIVIDARDRYRNAYPGGTTNERHQN